MMFLVRVAIVCVLIEILKTLGCTYHHWQLYVILFLVGLYSFISVYPLLPSNGELSKKDDLGS